MQIASIAPESGAVNLTLSKFTTIAQKNWEI